MAELAEMAEMAQMAEMNGVYVHTDMQTDGCVIFQAKLPAARFFRSVASLLYRFAFSESTKD